MQERLWLVYYHMQNHTAINNTASLKCGGAILPSMFLSLTHQPLGCTLLLLFKNNFLLLRFPIKSFQIGQFPHLFNSFSLPTCSWFVTRDGIGRS